MADLPDRVETVIPCGTWKAWQRNAVAGQCAQNRTAKRIDPTVGQVRVEVAGLLNFKPASVAPTLNLAPHFKPGEDCLDAFHVSDACEISDRDEVAFSEVSVGQVGAVEVRPVETPVRDLCLLPVRPREIKSVERTVLDRRAREVDSAKAPARFKERA